MADMKNQLDTTKHKFKIMQEKYNICTSKLEKSERDQAKLLELTAAMDQVESNGQSYLQMMKEMKAQLQSVSVFK